MFSQEISLEVALELPYGTLDIQDDIFKTKYELYHPYTKVVESGVLEPLSKRRMDISSYYRDGILVYVEGEIEGHIIYRLEMKNDTPHGEYIEYDFDSGNPIVYGSYVNGKKSGEWKIYSDNILQFTANYENDKLNGPAESYVNAPYYVNYANGKYVNSIQL